MVSFVYNVFDHRRLIRNPFRLTISFVSIINNQNHMMLESTKTVAKIKTPRLAIVMPCFNEEEIIQSSGKKIITLLNRMILNKEINTKSFIVFVDDGSMDSTWSLILKIKLKYKEKIKAIKLSRNYGHQNALMAGLEMSKIAADCIITIDADLQQDESKIPLFVEEFKKGNEIVFGVRNDRSADSFFKKNTAVLFYKIMKLFGTKVIKNHADYRLISSRVADVILAYKEKNLFLRGIVSNIGFRSGTVYFDVKERSAGKTKYSLSKMIYFAVNGITSFSTVPLKMITSIGFLVFIFSIFMSVYVLVQVVFFKNAVPGWASTVLPIYFLGGIQILCAGVVGEYLGKVYFETKNRPTFIVEQKIE